MGRFRTLGETGRNSTGAILAVGRAGRKGHSPSAGAQPVPRANALSAIRPARGHSAPPCPYAIGVPVSAALSYPPLLLLEGSGGGTAPDDEEDEELVRGGDTLLLDDEDDEVRGFHWLDEEELLEDIAFSQHAETTNTKH